MLGLVMDTEYLLYCFLYVLQFLKENLFSVILGIYLGVELLGQHVIVFFLFIFFTMAHAS